MSEDRPVVPRAEAIAAAEWWASRLGRASHDIGSRTASERDASAFAAFATAAAGRHFTDEQRDAFRTELATGIELHLRYWETGVHEGAWRPDEPQRGSGLRCFGCDYGPAAVLAEAAERAGFKIGSLDLPMKTSMFVNPGIVRVSEGHAAGIVTVWARAEARTLPARDEHNPATEH